MLRLLWLQVMVINKKHAEHLAWHMEQWNTLIDISQVVFSFPHRPPDLLPVRRNNTRILYRWSCVAPNNQYSSHHHQHLPCPNSSTTHTTGFYVSFIQAAQHLCPIHLFFYCSTFSPTLKAIFPLLYVPLTLVRTSKHFLEQSVWIYSFPLMILSHSVTFQFASKACSSILIISNTYLILYPFTLMLKTILRKVIFHAHFRQVPNTYRSHNLVSMATKMQSGRFLLLISLPFKNTILTSTIFLP